MGHAILNRLIGLVNKTLKMRFFSRKLSFSQFKLGFGSMTPEKTDLIEGRQQLTWILKPCYNRITKRIAKTVMEKTGIVKRIDKKIVQQVIFSNWFCFRYPLQYTCSYSFTCLPNIQNTSRTAWQQGRYSSATGETHNNCYKVV